MAQRRAEGLWYNCDEKFVTGHRCKKLFVIEIISFDNMEEPAEMAAGTADEPGISLHAIMGVRARGCQTMKMFVSITDTIGVALLYSNSSHNFININMAQRAGVRLQPCPSLFITVMNGDLVASLGKTPAQTVSIGSEAFRLNLYALPLGEYGMVLGVQWLGTLGPILWDFAKHTMCFARDG
jgi:hypothetical protein